MEPPLDMQFGYHTVFRPETLSQQAPSPLLIWASATCTWPDMYRPLLEHLASHGVFVVAGNTLSNVDGTAIAAGLQWALDANADPASPYFAGIAQGEVAVAAHSQGAQSLSALELDPRIRSVVLISGTTDGVSVLEPGDPPHLLIGADNDIVGSPGDYAAAVAAADRAAYIWYREPVGPGPLAGHVLVIREPERMLGPITAWLAYTLGDDAIAGRWFIGDDCLLCDRTDDLEFGTRLVDD